MAENDKQSRYDRELSELLQELRVAIPGVQVLFAFLLTVPFSQRFVTVTSFQRYTYFATLICVAVATAFLIAPSARHRMLFRHKDKANLLKISNVLAIVGLALLALGICGVVMLITDLLFAETTVIVLTAGVAAVFLILWYVAPIIRRIRTPEDERTPA